MQIQNVMTAQNQRKRNQVQFKGKQKWVRAFLPPKTNIEPYMKKPDAVGLFIGPKKLIDKLVGMTKKNNSEHTSIPVPDKLLNMQNLKQHMRAVVIATGAKGKKTLENINEAVSDLKFKVGATKATDSTLDKVSKMLKQKPIDAKEAIESHEAHYKGNRTAPKFFDLDSLSFKKQGS